MNFLRSLFSARPDPREAMRPLWARVVELARDPEWYRARGAADTLEGRFDMVSAVLALVLLRMERSPELAPHTAPLTEIFVEEMDGQLRQSGVGDLMVGKQIGKLMATLGGRVGAFRTALPSGDAEMTQAVLRNVTLADESRAGVLAVALRSLSQRLEQASDDALLRGEVA